MSVDIHHSKQQMFQIKVVYEDYYLLGCNAMSSSKNVVTFQGNLLNLSRVCVCVCVCIFWNQTTKSKKSYTLIKSKFYVMCKFICDEPFFRKIRSAFVYRRVCTILVKRWKKSQHFLLWNLFSFADKTYYGLSVICPTHNWIIKLNMLTKNWKQCNILTYFFLIDLLHRQ